MTDKIEVPHVTKILSLDEARAALGKKDADMIGVAGMKRNADKEFVLTTSLAVATGVAERVYNLMSEQQAEGLSKVEFMCMQHVEKLRQEIEGRTLMGRIRRFLSWLRTPVPIAVADAAAVVDALTPTGGVAWKDIPEPERPEAFEAHGKMDQRLTTSEPEVPRG